MGALRFQNIASHYQLLFLSTFPQFRCLRAPEGRGRQGLVQAADPGRGRVLQRPGDRRGGERQGAHQEAQGGAHIFLLIHSNFPIFQNQEDYRDSTKDKPAGPLGASQHEG